MLHSHRIQATVELTQNRLVRHNISHFISCILIKIVHRYSFLALCSFFKFEVQKCLQFQIPASFKIVFSFNIQQCAKQSTCLALRHQLMLSELYRNDNGRTETAASIGKHQSDEKKNNFLLLTHLTASKTTVCPLLIVSKYFRCFNLHPLEIVSMSA